MYSSVETVAKILFSVEPRTGCVVPVVYSVVECSVASVSFAVDSIFDSVTDFVLFVLNLVTGSAVGFSVVVVVVDLVAFVVDSPLESVVASTAFVVGSVDSAAVLIIGSAVMSGIVSVVVSDVNFFVDLIVVSRKDKNFLDLEAANFDSVVNVVNLVVDISGRFTFVLIGTVVLEAGTSSALAFRFGLSGNTCSVPYSLQQQHSR